MDSIVNVLIFFLLFANFIIVFILLKRKQPEQNNTEQILKDQVNSLRNSFSESFGSMSKEIAKDMTGALTKVDEKVGVFNQQVNCLLYTSDAADD